MPGPFINGRQRWQRLNAETFTDAKREAADLPDKLQAQALGVTVEEAKSNRVLIKTAVDTYLQQKATKARKTVLQSKTRWNNSLRPCEAKLDSSMKLMKVSYVITKSFWRIWVTRGRR